MSNPNKEFTSWEDAVVWLREQEDQKTLVFDAYYDDPLTDAADRYRNSAEWNAIKSYLGVERGAALDVGAGRGIASYALAKDGYSVTALEPDASAVVGAAAIRELARESELNIEVVEEFSESLPFADGQFDLVFARAVLHHAANLQATCEEFHRVLKPGGKLIAIREHVISRAENLKEFLEIHPLHKLYGGEHAYLLDEYVGALRLAGFHRRRSLGPLDSVINFAPFTEASLKNELVDRLRIPRGARKLLRSMLDVPAVWPTCRGLLSLFDNRPGRLYSFICERS